MGEKLLEFRERTWFFVKNTHKCTVIFSEGDETGSLMKNFKKEKLSYNIRRCTELQAADTFRKLLLSCNILDEMWSNFSRLQLSNGRNVRAIKNRNIFGTDLNFSPLFRIVMWCVHSYQPTFYCTF